MSNIKQKRPTRYRYLYQPIPLIDGMGLYSTGAITQFDREITYLHHHDRLEIGYCHQGDGTFVIEENIFPYKGGDMVWIPAGEMHLARSRPGTTSRWTWLYAGSEVLDFLGEDGRAVQEAMRGRRAGLPRLLTGEKHPGLAVWVRALAEELEKKAAGQAAAAKALFALVAVKVHRAFPQGLRAEGPMDPPEEITSRRLMPALSLMGRRYAEPLAVAELAAACNVSETHFRRLFLQAMGRTPLGYLNDLRLRVAQNLLKDRSNAISKVARLSGFDTLSTLDRRFRAACGVSPREWRLREAS